jgi:hypothetical protein
MANFDLAVVTGVVGQRKYCASENGETVSRIIAMEDCEFLSLARFRTEEGQRVRRESN